MKMLEKPRIALKWATPDAEREIESAGRVCWQSWGRSDGSIECAQDFIRRLKKVGHMDVMEEAELSIWIECSRTASHQIVRHRTQHHLQASQRYIKLDEPEYMIPPSVIAKGQQNAFQGAMEQAWRRYNNLMECGVRKEDARFVLPNACLTQLKAKANLSNWRKFIDLRSDFASQWEIQMISNAVICIAMDIAPSVFEDQYHKYLLEPKAQLKDVLFADILSREYFA